jgi:Arc/MetJ-type ribon-helix-helix transcriptional regulator
MVEAKNLTGIRFRPQQLEDLKKLVEQDREASVSSLVRRAVDEFLEKKKGKKK